MNSLPTQILKNIEIKLFELYDQSEAIIMFKMIIENFNNSDNHTLEKVCEDIIRKRPIQYIIGKAYFWDMEIHVEEGVLIPRPETDELVYYIQKTNPLNDDSNSKILDIGTGSGCIALALKKIFKNATVYATDLSKDALSIADINKEKNSLNVQFIQHDILGSEILLENINFDIIVSNPPYILPEEIPELEAHVLEHEPQTALFVTNNDPLQFYKSIENFANNRLTNSGNLYLELHSYYADQTKKYFENKGWVANLILDMQKKPRILHCNKN